MSELRVLRQQRDALDDQIQRLEWRLSHRHAPAESSMDSGDDPEAYAELLGGFLTIRVFLMNVQGSQSAAKESGEYPEAYVELFSGFSTTRCLFRAYECPGRSQCWVFMDSLDDREAYAELLCGFLRSVQGLLVCVWKSPLAPLCGTQGGQQENQLTSSAGPVMEWESSLLLSNPTQPNPCACNAALLQSTCRSSRTPSAYTNVTHKPNPNPCVCNLRCCSQLAGAAGRAPQQAPGAAQGAP